MSEQSEKRELAESLVEKFTNIPELMMGVVIESELEYEFFNEIFTKLSQIFVVFAQNVGIENIYRAQGRSNVSFDRMINQQLTANFNLSLPGIPSFSEKYGLTEEDIYEIATKMIFFLSRHL